MNRLSLLIRREMMEYSDGAYADHGSAENMLGRFADAVILNEITYICEWLNSDWPGDTPELRYHRAWIAEKIKLDRLDFYKPLKDR